MWVKSYLFTLPVQHCNKNGVNKNTINTEAKKTAYIKNLIREAINNTYITKWHPM